MSEPRNLPPVETSAEKEEPWPSKVWRLNPTPQGEDKFQVAQWTCDHELKTWPEYFKAICDGRKRFEIRQNDRDFQVGQWLLLREWVPDANEYTGAFATVQITYKTDWNQKEGTVVLGITGTPPSRPIPASVSPSVEVGGEEKLSKLANQLGATMAERDVARAQVEELRWQLDQFKQAATLNRAAMMLALDGIGGIEISLEALSSPGVPEVVNYLVNRITKAEATASSLRSSVEELAKAATVVRDRLEWVIQFLSEDPFKPWDNADEWLPLARKQLAQVDERLATFRASQGEEKGGRE